MYACNGDADASTLATTGWWRNIKNPQLSDAVKELVQAEIEKMLLEEALHKVAGVSAQKALEMAVSSRKRVMEREKRMEEDSEEELAEGTRHRGITARRTVPRRLEILPSTDSEAAPRSPTQYVRPRRKSQGKQETAAT